MAKRVRAARHYQHKDTAIRLIAERGKPGLRKDFREAFSHLGSLVPTEKVKHFARAGDWHNLKRAINWGHYHEVLKAPFGRIARIRQAGAALGVQKINGTFGQARRRVRFRKYDPNEPRDERGRWTDGGGQVETVTGYHGSRAAGLTSLDPESFTGGFRGDSSVLGAHIATGRLGEAAARSYGPNVYRVEATGRFYQLSEAEDRAMNSARDYRLLRDKLRSQGYDGLKYPEGGGHGDEVAIWTPGIIRVSPVTKILKDVGDRFNFDLLDQATQERIRQAQDDLIAQLEQDARDAIDTIIYNAVQDGETADEIVDDIRSMIGLTDTQAQAVMNYQSMLEDLDPGALQRQLRNTEYDAAIQDAIASGEDIAAAAVDAMVADYADNFLSYRADMIAQTESVRAASYGLSDAYQQAIDRGALPNDAVTRYWQVALDEKTCDICLSVVDNNPDGVGVGEDFDSVDGPQDDPPAHPNCRCSVEYVTDLDKVPVDEGF